MPIYCSDGILGSKKLDQLRQPVDSFATQSCILWKQCKCFSESQFYNIPGKSISFPSLLSLSHQHPTFISLLFCSAGQSNTFSEFPKYFLYHLQLLTIFTYVLLPGVAIKINKWPSQKRSCVLQPPHSLCFSTLGCTTVNHIYSTVCCCWIPANVIFFFVSFALGETC